MVRAWRLLVVVMVVGGCAINPTDPNDPDPTIPPSVAIPSLHLRGDKLTGAPMIRETPRDVCALAAELPGGDICALMCDPDAMKAQLRAEGEAAGQCVELSCGLPDDSRVIVGICLPPE